MIVVVGDLVIQAIEAFIHVDRAALLDRANRTNRLAMVAAAATFRMALQPIEHAAQNCQAAAKRANETAIKAFDEQAGRDNGKRVDNHRPFRHEAKNDGGLEWFDLGSRHR
jgi:hypothetical protein